MNTCLIMVNINLALGVKNPNPELGSIGFTNFFDLVKFFLTMDLAPTSLLPPPTSLTVLSLPTDTGSFTKSFTLIVFSMEVNKATI